MPVLEQARARGFLGPGPVERHVFHALGFAEAAGGRPAGPAVDLGSGGGVPGLPLALLWPATQWVLLDAGERRTSFLVEAIATLRLSGRVTVVRGRAEEVGRQPHRRAGHALVVARGFGPPAVTAECGAGLLSVGGRMVVSDPPGGAPGRWPAEPLARLGLAVGPLVHAGGGSYQVLVQVTPCPERFPRRPGLPAKRPLF